MEDNFKYFNGFFIVVIFFFLVGLFKYFSHENQFENNVDDAKNIKNYIQHILVIPDNYYFLQMNKLENYNNEYHVLIAKLFELIGQVVLYNNISTISIELISITDLCLMSQEEINEFINNKQLWQLVEEYANKMNLKINFIYNHLALPVSLISVLKTIENHTNIKKNIAEINFLIGYDLFVDIKNTFKKMILEESNKEKLMKKIETINIEKALLNDICPIDLTIVFNNATINDSLLLHMRQSKIMYLNYSLGQIDKETINFLIAESCSKLHSFV
jgi:hypothetical protein